MGGRTGDSLMADMVINYNGRKINVEELKPDFYKLGVTGRSRASGNKGTWIDVVTKDEIGLIANYFRGLWDDCKVCVRSIELIRGIE